ncbi:MULTISPECIES: head-tail adaptor protein [unclassified Mesorhizobium]|uniref:head-tail adaptor protein n=1 Tax=unclassified Mesorhizobium TaxID=325217 RepID=UPI00112D5650|nr:MULTISPECIES: head-tail adaptor protein [unclassified Mesorhizobium]TPJ86954.1 head-tail adaptor protein [Mesorhizobium sp. B2-5-12]TPK19177.1 head-tail adaptor protein [Mesorhizobium sp. B2-5-6]
MARTRSGQLNAKIIFQRRGDVTDDYGNVSVGAGPFEDVGAPFSARLQPIYGSSQNVEGVFASRLSAKQPYNLIVRNCAATRAVRTDWRVVDARQAQDVNGAIPRVFNIKTIVDPGEDRAWLEFLVVEGEAS